MTGVHLRSIAPGSKGFTLIEIMVVVVILGILAALVAPQVINRIDDAQISAAKTDIRAIESALQMYRMDNFEYPTTDEGLEALVVQPPDARNWRQSGYLERARIPLDPWKNPYLYLSPGQNGQFDISSLGRDGVPGGEGIDKDINNWELD